MSDHLNIFSCNAMLMPRSFDLCEEYKLEYLEDSRTNIEICNENLKKNTNFENEIEKIDKIGI